MDKIELHFGGKILSGFDQVEISVTLDEIAGDFSLVLPDRSRSKARGLILPDIDTEVSLHIGKSLALKGYVEIVKSRGSIEGGFVSTLHGREITCDLVDSSITRSKKLSGPIDRIIGDIAAPFKISVISHSSRNAQLTAEMGTGVWETIETLSRKTGDMIWTRGDGILQVGTGKRQTYARQLTQQNIKFADSKFSSHDLHSEYGVVAMMQSTAEAWGKDNKKTVSVPGSSSRHRPLVIRGEAELTPAEGLARARWEASIRDARSISASVTIAGHRIGEELAELNRLVEVDYQPLGLKNTMMVSSLKFLQSKGLGNTTVIGLSLPDAFKPNPVDIRKARGESRKIRGWSE